MDKLEKKILLIFDLDETLIHARREKLDVDPAFMVDEYFIYKRPGLDEFLESCNKKYRLAIWSSADDEYVKKTVSGIVSDHIKLDFIWTRLNCSVKVVRKPIMEGENYGSYKEYQWIKPISRIRKKGIGIKKMLIIDNSAYKVKESKENALIIKSYEGDRSDNELENLLNFLSNFDEKSDVRKVDKENWAI